MSNFQKYMAKQVAKKFADQQLGTTFAQFAWFIRSVLGKGTDAFTQEQMTCSWHIIQKELRSNA